MSAENPEIADLAARLVARAGAASLSIGIAESCTGGLVGGAITGVSGSSRIFRGSVVAYADGVKERILGVPLAVLETEGAVSEAVARAMAQGARAALGADLAVGVTGIAGPGGGSPGKPVGLVFVALAGEGRAEVRRFVFPGSREEIRWAAVRESLALLLRALE